MKVTMVMVASVDGCTTQGDEPDVTTWASSQDAAEFSAVLDRSTVVVMGSSTYDAVHPRLAPSGRTRIVLTSTPARYAGSDVAEGVEFSSEAPEALVGRLRADGHRELLLLGGGVLNHSFLSGNLVDELALTIEPRLFGTGTSLAGTAPLDVSLRLLGSRQLNEAGTLLLHYAVERGARPCG